MSGSARTFLGIAAILVTIESVVYVSAGVLELSDASGGLVGAGIGAGILFILYGLLQFYAAWRVRQGRAWARAPLIVTQLIQLLLAGDVQPEGLPWLASVMAVSALVVVVCLLAPPVTRALSANGSV
ncbi:MAG: hypothetical protein ACR2FE_09630 [Aeromicrobium sp.]